MSKIFDFLALHLLYLTHQIVANPDLNSITSILESEQVNQPFHHYHAPARHVPFPVVNPEIKEGFLLLFQRDYISHMHDTPHDHIKSLNSSAKHARIVEKFYNLINNYCPREAFFYYFAERHQKAIKLLQQEFMGTATPEDILGLARTILYHHDINPRVWYFALFGTLLSRPDLNGYYLPRALDATPDMYIPASILSATLGTSHSHIPLSSSCDQLPTPKVNSPPLHLLGGPQSENCTVWYSGTNGATDPNENRLWYFREDLMVNEHHWFWHQYYPFTSEKCSERRGELFYFTHHNLVARYNAERLSNNLNIVAALNIHISIDICTGYSSGLMDKQSELLWTPRRANTIMRNIYHINNPDFQLDITLEEMKRIYRDLVTHVAEGYLITNKSSGNQTYMAYKMSIKNKQGVDQLANTLEAVVERTTVSDFYHSRGFHNLAHIMASLSADPNYTCKSPPGVLGNTATAMRDPAFYRLHTLVDDIFYHYKNTLPPYELQSGDWPLVWEGVRLTGLKISQGEKAPRNYVRTFWSVKRLPLEQGIDGSIHDGDVNADICNLHLNHDPFAFILTVNVSEEFTSVSKMGTVRIFMAPRYNVEGRRFSMEKTRRLMFQLDSFQAQLHPGKNIITRNSEDSAATRPWSRSLQEKLADLDNGGETEYCGCGWPRHLYIPKGTPEGMEFDLFAMITNYDEEHVEDPPEFKDVPEPCHSPFILCGVPYRNYPDARPMGYPFDREISDSHEHLEEFVSNVPNMKSRTIKVQHMDVIM